MSLANFLALFLTSVGFQTKESIFVHFVLHYDFD